MRVLFATDLQKSSVNAYRYCLMLAKEEMSRVIVLHVFHRSRFLHLNESQKEQFYQKQHEVFLDRTRQFSRLYPNAVESEELMRVEISAEVEEGSAAGIISSTATEKNVDMIVIVAKEHPGLFRRLFGQVSRKLIYDLSIPVLIVPEGFTGGLPERIGVLRTSPQDTESITHWVETHAAFRQSAFTEFSLSDAELDEVTPGKALVTSTSLASMSNAQVQEALLLAGVDLLVFSINSSDSDRSAGQKRQLIHYLYEHLPIPMICLHGNIE